METLAIAKGLKLNDCWVGAGLIRNAVWDSLHQIKTTKRNDIDVVFFDATTLSEALEKEIEAKLIQINPNVKWSVKNQARMHLRNNHKQYSNTENAISYWPETATAIAARLNPNEEIEILAPHGLNDLFNLVVAPTPNFDWNMFQERIEEKQWKKQWKNLKVIQTKEKK
ncbi:nucleotidyltransferase family protein [Flavobacterium sufflavum]|uniref:Nucleotidyltransferase family protein n=2 Tax=Flavobacterium sufflavum TaxID=1921138 RepID=A0A437KWH1_9FLAO|nr:nucleotidyltransferase family protein [Flavobacterium sufflavum]